MPKKKKKEEKKKQIKKKHHKKEKTKRSKEEMVQKLLEDRLSKTIYFCDLQFKWEKNNQKKTNNKEEPIDSSSIVQIFSTSSNISPPTPSSSEKLSRSFKTKKRFDPIDLSSEDEEELERLRSVCVEFPEGTATGFKRVSQSV
jgi:hypothetical protein